MALRVKPNWMPALRVALVANAMQGKAEETARVLSLYRRIDPQARIAKICGFYPQRRERDRQRLIRALRIAGMPE